MSHTEPVVQHADTDETFIVIDGRLRIDFRDGHVTVNAGEMYVVPRGVEHKPVAETEVRMLLIEPRGVVNTGDQGGERTARNDSAAAGIGATPASKVVVPACGPRP